MESVGITAFAHTPMAEIVWKLYEVIRWGSDHHPKRGDGPDTIFLVRAENPAQAAETAERELKYIRQAGVSTNASTIYELGVDTAVYARHGAASGPLILRGPYFQHANCKGWKRYDQDSPGEPWVEERYYDGTQDSTSLRFSFLIGTDDRLSPRKLVSAPLAWITIKLLHRIDVVDDAMVVKLRKNKHAGVFIEEAQTQIMVHQLTVNVLPQIQAGEWSMIDLRKPAKFLTERGNAELLEQEKKDVQEWLEAFLVFCGECMDSRRYEGFTILRMY